jgi:hypothetical protein
VQLKKGATQFLPLRIHEKLIMTCQSGDCEILTLQGLFKLSVDTHILVSVMSSQKISSHTLFATTDKSTY